MTPSHQNYLQNSQKKSKHSGQNNLISRYICALFERSQRKTTMNLRSGSKAAATSKMECFVIIVNGWKPLTIITRHSILDVAAGLDPPLNLHIPLLWSNLARTQSTNNV